MSERIAAFRALRESSVEVTPLITANGCTYGCALLSLPPSPLGPASTPRAPASPLLPKSRPSPEAEAVRRPHALACPCKICHTSCQGMGAPCNT
eukprot:scaffold17153_cov107-Isochrysis_galbana.AAC.3